MTFIEEVGASVGPIVVVFVLGALVAAILTPIVRRILLRYRIVDRPNARRVNTRPVPRAGGVAIAAAFLLVAGAFVVLNEGARWVPTPLTLQPGDFLALFVGGRRLRPSVRSTTSSTCALGGSWPDRSGWP